MHIAIVSPVWFAVPPSGYGGIEWVVSLLADGLFDAGHDVTLFASGDSHSKAHLSYVFEQAPSEQIGATVVWTGTEMIVWAPEPYNAARYIPALDRWLPLRSRAQPAISPPVPMAAPANWPPNTQPNNTITVLNSPYPDVSTATGYASLRLPFMSTWSTNTSVVFISPPLIRHGCAACSTKWRAGSRVRLNAFRLKIRWYTRCGPQAGRPRGIW